MKNYQTKKEQARQRAIDWQSSFYNGKYGWNDLADKSKHFAKLGKKYGLRREFKENGII